VYGETNFTNACVGSWALSNITRNYNIVTLNRTDEAVGDVELILYGQNNTLPWKGYSDSSGRTNFNITFTDSNYTDTLKLEAVKGDYSATMNVSFLSDTPVVLTMRYFADLNGDGTIDIRDITIVAMAFGSNIGDESWNIIADLNEDEVIDIRDITVVALEFGKTA